MQNNELLKEIAVLFDQNFTKLDNRLERVETRLEEMDKRFETIETRLEEMDSRIGNVEEQLVVLNRRVTSLELTLGNETNRGIQIIAEGHWVLNRKLDDALKGEGDRVKMMLSVNHLENEVRKIKEQITA